MLHGRPISIKKQRFNQMYNRVLNFNQHSEIQNLFRNLNIDDDDFGAAKPKLVSPKVGVPNKLAIYMVYLTSGWAGQLNLPPVASQSASEEDKFTITVPQNLRLRSIYYIEIIYRQIVTFVALKHTYPSYIADFIEIFLLMVILDFTMHQSPSLHRGYQ